MCVRHLTQFPFPLLLPLSPKRRSCLVITMFTQKHTSGHVHTHVHTRHTLTVTHAYARMHSGICVHMHTEPYTRAHRHALTHTHMHAHTHAHSHTHSHTHALTRAHNQLLLLGLINMILNLTSVSSQDNVFISWAHSHADFHNTSSCWVCRAMPLSVMEGLPWWESPLCQGDFKLLCSFLG